MMEIDQPIDLINRVSQQLLLQGQHVSPILNAIQELDGAEPGEKYRRINEVVKAKSKKNADSKIPNLDVPTQLQDFLSTKVNIEMKSIDEVIRCLKSEDKTLIAQAFKAKWFFHHNNPNLEADFFASSIIPYVSPFTRFRIIKELSRCLVASPKKADKFFTFFVDVCGTNIALPLLAACSEDFIYNEIMKRKLILPNHMLLPIYKRHPKVVVRYLNLGHYKNKKNEEARKIHSIELSNYKNFTPHLIRHDIEYFIELVESYWWMQSGLLKIGSTLTLLFFKKAINIFIEKPALFLRNWPIKVVSKRLTIKQYETMYFNLFPKTSEDFRQSLLQMINYLKGYPKKKRYDLISNHFKLKYQKDFAESFGHIELGEFNAIYDDLSVELYEKLFINLFPGKGRFRASEMLTYLEKYPQEKRLNLLMQTFQLKYGENLLDDVERVRSEKVFVLLPPDLKMTLAKKIVEPYEIKSTEYYDHYYYLPLSECFPIYKEAIQKSSDANDRYSYLEKMVKSCALYNNMEDLLQVIKYYNIRHANEKLEIFTKFLRYIERSFNLKTFGEKLWFVILELFQKLSIKGELSKVSYVIEPYFSALVYCLYCVETNPVSDDTNKQSILTTFHNLVVDDNVERYTSQKWIFSEYLSVQKTCFDSLLQCFHTKYPPEHYIWKKDGLNKKGNMVEYILDAMNKFNANVKKLDSLQKLQKYDARDYPWLLNMIKEIFDSRVTSGLLSSIKLILKKHSPELYNSFTGGSNFAVDIKSGSAWIQLKKKYNEVMVHWQEYLNQCREELNFNSKCGGAAARRFLLSTKWYNSLPIFFVEQCLKELNEPGSLKVLAILLDSEVFTSLATTLAPKESITTYQNAKDYFALVQAIPPAINFVNPPLPFDVIIMYCQGNYTKLAIQAFEHVTHLVPKEKIMIFADSLINKPVSVKKHGIRLFFKVASVEELQSFVTNLLVKEKHASIREFICNVSQERLIKSPTAENWRLVQICISALTTQDEACLKVLSNVEKMKNKFLPEYTTEFVKKIDELSEDPEFPEAIKISCISTLLSNFTLPVMKYLTSEIILQLLEKYYFDTDSLQISNAAQNMSKIVFSERYLRGR